MANFPRYWVAASNGLGISAEGFGVQDGLKYFEFRLNGTGEGDSSLLAFEGSTIIPALAGEDWTQSFYLWQVAGSQAGLGTWHIRLAERDAAGGPLTGQTTAIVPTTNVTQFSHTRTLTDPDTRFVLPRLSVFHNDTESVEVTMRVAEVSMRKSKPVVFTDREIFTIERLPTDSPRYRTIIGYAKNYTVDGGQGVAAIAPDTYKAFARQEYRTAQSTDSTVLTAHPNAAERRVDTTILGKSNAASEASRRQTLFGQRRDVFRLSLKAQPFAVDLGDVVTVQTERFGLAAGKKFNVISLNEDASDNTIDVDLWG